MTEIQKRRLETLEETHQRRNNQIARVYELKIVFQSLTKEQKQSLPFAFVQAKRIVNDLLRISETENIFKYNYKDHKTVQVKFPDGHFEDRNITLPSAMHQDLCQAKMTDVKNLHKSKLHGRKVGKLKFKSEVNTIPIRTGMISLNKKNQNKITIPGFQKIRVRGTKSFRDIPEYEIANATLIKKPSGYYIHICIMLPKKKSNKTESIGIDMGIKTNIVTSEGVFINSLVEESDHLKRLQRKLARQTRGSNNYEQVKLQLRKEHEHLINKRNDEANKIYHGLTKDKIVYFQDEQLANWAKFNFGKTISHSVLGRVKSKLMMLEKETNHEDAVCISKWTATTKVCFDCGSKHEMTLDDRIFVCPVCGHRRS